MVTLKDRLKQLNELKQLTENQPQFVPPPADDSSQFSVVEEEEAFDEGDVKGDDIMDEELTKMDNYEIPESEASHTTDEHGGKETVFATEDAVNGGAAKNRIEALNKEGT